MNLSVFLRNPEKIDDKQEKRMNNFWGDDTWKEGIYEQQPTLFGDLPEKKSNYEKAITKAYKKRLKEIAGFKYVPEPRRMYNTRNGTLYYLYFASHKPVAQKIVEQIFKKYS